MRKMGKVAMALVVAVLALSMMACNPSGGKPANNDVIGQGIIDVTYANGFGGLLSMLNATVGTDLAGYEVGAADQPFSPMGAEIGTVTVTRYNSETDYAYSAEFKKGTFEAKVGPMVLAKITVDEAMSVTYSMNGTDISYTADVPSGGSGLTVTLGQSTNPYISADLPMDLAFVDEAVTVAGREYTADETAAYVAYASSLTDAIDGLRSAEAPTELAGTGYSFAKDETVTDEGKAAYTGTVMANAEDVEVSFMISYADSAWSYDSITIDSEALSASNVARINEPYINM